MKDNHFSHLFWFCSAVFILSFAAMLALLFCHIPEQNREMASNAQGFLQGSLIMSAVGFLLGGSPVQSRKNEAAPGTTVADISATVTTTTDENKQP